MTTIIIEVSTKFGYKVDPTKQKELLAFFEGVAKYLSENTKDKLGIPNDVKVHIKRSWY